MEIFDTDTIKTNLKVICHVGGSLSAKVTLHLISTQNLENYGQESHSVYIILKIHGYISECGQPEPFVKHDFSNTVTSFVENLLTSPLPPKSESSVTYILNMHFKLFCLYRKFFSFDKIGVVSRTEYGEM